MTPAQVLELAKDDAELSIMDRIDVLKTVVYHVHADTPNSLQPRWTALRPWACPRRWPTLWP